MPGVGIKQRNQNIVQPTEVNCAQTVKSISPDWVSN